MRRWRVFLVGASWLIGLAGMSTHAQVNVAMWGESGFGATVAGAFSSDVNAVGMQLTGTMSGIADLGISLVRESPDGPESYWVKGMQFSLVPLRSREADVRWNLGGRFTYYFANVSYSTYHYDYYSGYSSISSSTRQVEIWSASGVMFVDIDISPRTWLQFVTSVQYVAERNSRRDAVNYTVGLGVVTNPHSGPKVYLLPTFTVPSRGELSTFGVELGLFWGHKSKRRF